MSPASRKKLGDRGTALFHSRRAGGELMGSAAGLLSPAWGFAARDWRTAVAGTTLFAQSVLVAARASLWRSARLGAGMHARHRHRSFCSAVRERCGRRDHCFASDSRVDDDVCDPGYRHRFLFGWIDHSRGRRRGQRRPGIGVSGGAGVRRRRLGFSRGGFVVEFVVHFGQCNLCALGLRHAEDSAPRFCRKKREGIGGKDLSAGRAPGA